MKKVCSNLGLKWKSLEWTTKAGAEIEVGPVDVGAGFFKNNTTKETGGQLEANFSNVLGIALLQVNPPGAAINSDSGQKQVHGQFMGMDHNFSDSSNVTNIASTSNSIGGLKLGVMLGIGLEASLNANTYKQLAAGRVARPLILNWSDWMTLSAPPTE